LEKFQTAQHVEEQGSQQADIKTWPSKYGGKEGLSLSAIIVKAEEKYKKKGVSDEQPIKRSYGNFMKNVLEDFENGEVFNLKKEESLFGPSDTPAVILHNPKYPHNVGAVVRALSCFGGKTLVFTGNRVSLTPPENKGYRLPREERMKGYKDVTMINDDYPFNRFSKNVIPVAIEVRRNSTPLPIFEHPENAVYVFGPEDGSIPQVMLQHCQRFVVIPSKHCLNLAAAVNVILYDRISKLNILIEEDIR